MADDEDDYMSDAVLAKCDEKAAQAGSRKPAGLCWDPKMQRKRKIEEKALETNLKNRTKPVRVVEQERRAAGLNAALDEKNKGFALLQKMGYKPGTAIGKAGVGLVEPVAVELKLGRTGLGTEAEDKRRQDDARARLQSAAMRRARLEANLKADFVGAMSARFNVKAVERDLRQSQSVCEQLDAAKGIEQPLRSFFWFHLPKEEEEELVEEEEEEEEQRAAAVASEDDDSPAATKITSLRERVERTAAAAAAAEEDACLDVCQRLELLTGYLRSEYLYCVWCGTTFNDAEDMAQNCPGSTAEMHDSASELADA